MEEAILVAEEAVTAREAEVQQAATGGHVALAERPALLLTTMLIVLGAQVLGLGLIGELIIFTHARQLREYQIERLIQAQAPPEAPRPAPQGLERVGS